MCIFVCKLHLHFPDSKHLRGFVCHEIFGNFFRHSEIFGLHPPPTIHASYGPAWSPVSRYRHSLWCIWGAFPVFDVAHGHFSYFLASLRNQMYIHLCLSYKNVTCLFKLSEITVPIIQRFYSSEACLTVIGR